MDMCHQQRPGLSVADLPKSGTVKIEEYADAAQGGFNLAVYPVGRQIDKARRQLGQQRLKFQSIFQDLLCPLALGDFRLP
jgi:hypothetical protein